jgi:hypothetical protein
MVIAHVEFMHRNSKIFLISGYRKQRFMLGRKKEKFFLQKPWKTKVKAHCICHGHEGS